MVQRKGQAKKKARLKRRAEAVKATRKGKKPPAKKTKASAASAS